MFSKWMLLFLGATLVLQGYNAAPYQDMESAKQALRERLKLRKLFLSELIEVRLLYIRESIVALENVLKDPKVLEVKSDLMKTKLEELRSFIKKFKDFDKKVQKEPSEYKEIFDGASNIIAEYDRKNGPVEKIQENKIISKSLTENGFDTLPPSMEARFKIFADNVYEEVEKYVNGLNETGKKDESAVLDLMQKMKAESVTEKRIDLLYKFLENFELENFLW